MAYNNNNSNNNNNRLNYQLPLNFQQVILSQNSAAAATSSNNQPQLLTPRSVIHKFFSTNLNQHLPDRFDYQTYFNVHGLCGRRSVSPVYYNSNQPAINLQSQFQNCYNAKQHHQHQQNSSYMNNNNYYPSSNYNNNHPQIHYGISNTYSLVEPSTPNALKIPTTPTRSKSLSPSLRTVVQPPRIRHKQNVANANISLAASTTSVSFGNKHQTQSLPKMTNNPPSLNQPNSHKPTNNLVIQQQQPQNKNEIKKPIPIIPTAKLPPPSNPFITTSQDDESKKKSTSFHALKESNEIKSNSNHPSDILNEKKIKTIKFKLPINVRMINYSNFPQYKKTSNKLKNPDLQNQEYCLNLLRKTLQVSVNEKIKPLFDAYKNDYIQPMIENFRKNYGSSCNMETSDEDAYYVCIQLLDQAKEMFSNEIEKLKSEGSELVKTTNVVNTTKRKSLYEAYCEKLAAKSFENLNKDESQHQNNKKQKLNENTTNTKDEAITTNTKFVLGQNANKLFLLTSVENDNNNNNNNKSIYTKYPSLFKYELDQVDKQYLFDNLIIPKKMVKLYIFLYIDLLELFKTAIFNKKNEIEEGCSDDEEDVLGSDEVQLVEKEATGTSDSVNGENNKNRIEFINKQLNPFQLPQFMIYKLKKQYFNFKKV